jgi:hypothetical protein
MLARFLSKPETVVEAALQEAVRLGHLVRAGHYYLLG